MTRLALGLLALLIAAGAAAATWSDLWLRPDQQAERALESGHAATAAKLFEDPRLRGFAEIQAKQYAEAAKQLAPLADPQSQYNRGNALARSGQLRPALGAYDAALKQAPPGSPLARDARNNRDLVARQLEQPPPDSKNQPGKTQGSGQQSGPDGQSQPQSGTGSSPKSQPQSSQSGASGPQSQAARAPEQDAGQGAQTPGSASSADQPPPGASPEGRGAQPPPSPKAAGEAQQAERDAAAALESKQKPQNGQPGTGATTGGNPADHSLQAARAPNAGVPPQPPSEQALALDQWLRWIPDDPSGLLRRKFLIEHMMKQRDPQP
jgi:Ca-activated chloride channel family protein